MREGASCSQKGDDFVNAVRSHVIKFLQSNQLPYQKSAYLSDKASRPSKAIDSMIKFRAGKTCND